MTVGAVLDNSYDILSGNGFKRSRSMEKLDELKPYADPVRGFADSVDLYSEFLESLDAQYLWLLSDVERIKLQKKLRFIYLLISAQIKFESQNSRYHEISNLMALRRQCYSMLLEIRKIEKKLDCPKDEIKPDIKPLLPKRVFLCVNGWTKDEIDDLRESPSSFTRDWMGRLNERRLYWVWGGSMLYSIMKIKAIRNNTLVHYDEADFILSHFGRFTGALSWILYLLRLMLNIIIVLKHTIPCYLWMSDEELKACQNTWFFNRFATHFMKRYSQILNDLFWGIANFLCANVLKGTLRLSSSNDLLTCILLFFDFIMRSIEFILALRKYNKELNRLSQKISILEEKYHSKQISQELYEEKKDILQSAITKLSSNWKFEKRRLLTEMGYAFFLFAAFFAMTMPFIPLASMPLAILGVSGAVICHFSAIALNIIHLVINRREKTFKMNECAVKIDSCLSILNNQDSSILMQKKAYLEMRKLEAQHEFLKAQNRYEFIQAIRSTVFDTFIPLAVFVCLALIPVGFGIPILLLGCVAMIGLQLAIKGKFEPAGPKKVFFDERGFQCTKVLCTGHNNIKISTLHGFFKNIDKVNSRQLLPANSHEILSA